MDFPSPELAEQIFNEIDVRKQGALTINDFRILSQFTGDQFTDADAAFIFEQLDVNKDGLVSKEEFVSGFARALNLGDSTSHFCGIKRRASGIALGSNPRHHRNSLISPATVSIEENELCKNSKSTELGTVADKLDVLPCQEEVLSLYGRLQSLSFPQSQKRLRSASVQDLLNQFERIIDGVCKELNEQKDQNQRMQELFKKEKIRHNHQIDEVESNINSTLIEAREKARREERERLEREKEQICQQFETELAELKATVSTLQKSVIEEDNENQQKNDQFKQKVQELSKENLRLRHNLAEKQTELALIQASMAKVRQHFDDKFSDWASEREQLVQLTDETNQKLQLLYDANKQLHDTNDNLRSALETRHAFSRHMTLRTPSPIGSAGRASPKLLGISAQGSWSQNHSFDGASICEAQTRPNHLSLRRWDAVSIRGPDSVETDEDVGFSDSGMITRGSNSADSTEDDSQRRRGWNGLRPGATGATQMSTEYPMVRTDTLSTSSSGTRSCNEYELKSKAIEPTGVPERTFRIVMAGDSAVGKTSLIMRLVKGDFITYPATIVEYQSKCLHVDGKNVALQLWDTAGQEKFRSLCRTYFRRADGAVLAYDSTCEQSFLNVRYWLDAVQDTITRKIPVLLCATKIDLRVAAAAQGKRCVSREDGENLAKTHSILFVETSAKDGINICEAAVQLTRELLAAEDFEVRSTCVVLEQKKKKSSCTSCKS